MCPTNSRLETLWDESHAAAARFVKPRQEVDVRMPLDWLKGRCPECGHRLQPGDWPFCDKNRHAPVEQGVGHPVVVRW